MPKFRSVNQQGEWTEQLLVLKTIEIGLNPSWPIRRNLGYDLSVENPERGSTKRLQVKSVDADSINGAYVACCRRWKRRSNRPYTAREVDLFAFYIIPEDVWYIVPTKAIGRRWVVRLRPGGGGYKREFEKYREAWHLLF